MPEKRLKRTRETMGPEWRVAPSTLIAGKKYQDDRGYWWYYVGYWSTMSATTPTDWKLIR